MVSFSARYVKRKAIIFTKHSLKKPIFIPSHTYCDTVTYYAIRDNQGKDTEKCLSCCVV